MQNKILELFACENKLQRIKSGIDFSKTSFELWEKFADKHRYRYLLGINTPVGIFIEKYCSWIKKERYRILELEMILDAIDELLKRSEMSVDEAEELKRYLQKINFGSMIIDW
ncbi:hypothetical protein UT300003_32440 [Clostridium sardiniense]